MKPCEYSIPALVMVLLGKLVVPGTEAKSYVPGTCRATLPARRNQARFAGRFEFRAFGLDYGAAGEPRYSV